MKYLMLILAIAMNLVCFAQTERNPPLPIEHKDIDAYLAKRRPPVLKVRVVNSNTSLEGVQVKYSVLHLGAEMQITSYTKLNANGEVDIVLSENLPYQQVWLDVKGILYTGLLINANMEVQADVAKAGHKQIYFYGNGLIFNGADAGLNEAMSKGVLFEKKKRQQLQSLLVDKSIETANKNLRATDYASITAFIKTADSIQKELYRWTADFVKNVPGFEWAIKNETESHHYSWLITGFGNAPVPDSIRLQILHHKPFFTSNDGVAFYRSLSSHLAYRGNNGDKANVQQLLRSGDKQLTFEQKTILDSITYYEAQARPDGTKTPELNRLYTLRYKLFKPEIEAIYLRESISAIEKSSSGTRSDLLKLCLMERQKDNFKSAYPLLMPSIKTRWAQQFVKYSFEQAVANQKEINQLFNTGTAIRKDSHYIGKSLVALPFNAQLYVLDSIDNIDDFIIALKEKFKNNALILDIWGTWCAPCISDLPNSKKLHEENADLPVTYIYLCTASGSDVDTWKNRLGTLKVPGIHIFINEELEAALRKRLNAEGGYPTYVVIDSKGKVKANEIVRMGALNRDRLMQVTGLK